MAAARAAKEEEEADIREEEEEEGKEKEEEREEREEEEDNESVAPAFPQPCSCPPLAPAPVTVIVVLVASVVAMVVVEGRERRGPREAIIEAECGGRPFPSPPKGKAAMPGKQSGRLLESRVPGVNPNPPLHASPSPTPLRITPLVKNVFSRCAVAVVVPFPPPRHPAALVAKGTPRWPIGPNRYLEEGATEGSEGGREGVRE